jgi:hypothetical protein
MKERIKQDITNCWKGDVRLMLMTVNSSIKNIKCDYTIEIFKQIKKEWQQLNTQ